MQVEVLTVFLYTLCTYVQLQAVLHMTPRKSVLVVRALCIYYVIYFTWAEYLRQIF